MLCTAYAASLHLLALIRAAHYFSFQKDHSAVRSVEAAGVKGWWMAWWAGLLLWPLPVYFVPLLIRYCNGQEHDVDALQPHTAAVVSQAVPLPGVTAGGNAFPGVTVTMLLGGLAAHAVTLTCAESVFAHLITKTPAVQGLDASDDDEADPENRGSS